MSLLKLNVRRDDAIGVIQCAGTKRPEAGHFVGDDGRKVLFVADPRAAPPSPALRHARPDDATPAGPTYRERLEQYNRDRRADNPWGLLPAGELYRPPAYKTLVDALGVGSVFVLSAGWGLVRADYLLPNYDITFSSSAKDRNVYKRRRPSDSHYRDFAKLPRDTEKHVFFFGGKDYLPLFCALTRGIARRTVFFNSRTPPHGANCRTVRYEIARKTNWQYECVDAFVARLRNPG